MAHGNKWAECPNCGKKAFDRDEIDKKFGYRNMGDGRHIPQSYCKECRVNEAKKKKKMIF